MIGALAVASSIALPVSPLLASMATVSVGPLLLIILTAIFAWVTQRSVLPWSSANNSTLVDQNPSQNSQPITSLSLPIIRYFLVAGLAAVLIVGSALQALISHQQADATAINEPMRVQALVTLEGVSDSVYDVTTNSGYRQVATIEQITPLVSELTVQDLNNATISYAENINNNLSGNNPSNNPSNNLSNNGANNSRTNSNRLNNDQTENLEYRVLLNAYPKQPSQDSQTTILNDLRPGDQLFMTLTLAPIETSQAAIDNPSGFDSYRWLRSRHIDGVADIIGVSTSVATIGGQLGQATASDSYLKRLRVRIDQWRWQLRQHFYQDWSQRTTAQQQAKAVTLSLLTGDRSLISRDTKDLYQLAGISHLLAISGTHVLFLALMLAGAAALLFDRLCPIMYRYIPRWQIRWLVMISAAFIYALFTGFDVPAARTAWMLLAIGAVRLTLLPISTMRVLLALAVLMAWVDPYVLWQAGYWLSFVAVALILKYDSKQYTHNKITDNNRQNISQHTNEHKSRAFAVKIGEVFKRLFKLQCWLFIALLPITLFLFGKVSLWGLVINLFAIGLFGWVIVPLNLLAGLCYLLLPAVANGVADSIWALVSAIVASLHALISWLTALPALAAAWLYTPVNTGILLITLLAMLPWLLPRGLISRWLALPPLALLILIITVNQQSVSLTPTLYVLPTGDRYLSAAVLQYPIHENKIDGSEAYDSHNDEDIANKRKQQLVTENVSWLFLADHRGRETRTMPSSLTADKLSATLEQQLRTLSIKRLEGIVVQTSVISLTDTLSAEHKGKKINENFSELLPMTVAQLSQRLPISRYWQAGRSDLWPTRPQASGKTDPSKNKPNISAQRCEQGKTWQLANSNLSLQVLTGWPKIADTSVWDCTVAIDSNLPINVVKYYAADPLRSQKLAGQALDQTTVPRTINAVIKDSQQSGSQQKSSSSHSLQTRVIIDAATHQRVWQLWPLLCSAEPMMTNTTVSRPTTWLGHSASNMSAEALTMHNISRVLTYDEEVLEAALALGVNLGAEQQ
ncbi:competence protein ComEC [Psychrobacter sp. PL19]|uniref:ComEC/Rec2 family competence protein n=1 Tax=Psychrobacter sp. PL19 TaxID=2760711 RepID=UPI002FF090DF